MAIDKRVSNAGKVSYRVRMRTQAHPEVSATFDRLVDAREFEARARVLMRAGQWSVQSEAKRHTLTIARKR